MSARIYVSVPHQMYLTHLSLTNFRSFARLDLDVPRRVVLLVGSNAQGKTSVLEAVYFLAAFTSFQTHVDRQLVNFVEAKKSLAVGRLVAEYTRGPASHRLEVRLILEPVGVNGTRLRKEALLDASSARWRRSSGTSTPSSSSRRWPGSSRAGPRNAAVT